MIPTIKTLTEKKLIGQRMAMTFVNNTTGLLWKTFMPRQNEIQNRIGTELYSMQLYRPLFFEQFNPNSEFEKWATMEVSSFEAVPDGMETFTLPEGLYAFFFYKGDASNAESTFKYILGTWLPNSDYLLDNRPHFEILGANYKKDDPNSEEEIWIPIKLKD